MIHESQPQFWLWTREEKRASFFAHVLQAQTPKIAAMAERAKLVARLVFVCDPLR
jgi:hypothetical protein